jgi:DNA-binding winged helix-turn-helix (wHTH) protein
MPGTAEFTLLPQVADRLHSRVHSRDRINTPTKQSVAFGPFRLFPMQRLLTNCDQRVHLGSRAFDILVALLESPGTLVDNEELMARVWPKTFVGSANLAVHISALRRALGEGRRQNRYIINIPGRGYRFIAPITVENRITKDSASAVQHRERPMPTHLIATEGRAETVGELPSQRQQLGHCEAEICSHNSYEGPALQKSELCSSCFYRRAFHNCDTTVLPKL